MKFGELTAASATLRDMAKEAGFVANALKRVVGGVGKTITAPVRLPAKGALGFAKKHPLATGFGALTALDAGSKARGTYRAQSRAMSNIRNRGAWNAATRRAARLDPTPDIAPMSRF